MPTTTQILDNKVKDKHEEADLEVRVREAEVDSQDRVREVGVEVRPEVELDHLGEVPLLLPSRRRRVGRERWANGNRGREVAAGAGRRVWE